MDAPPVRYAMTSDGVSIAYKILGSGPHTIIHVAAVPSDIERGATLIPEMYYLWEELAEHGFRITSYDPRGTGMSTREVGETSPETLRLDLEAIVDALETTRFTLYTFGTAITAAVPYAIDHPDRVAALILDGAIADGSRIKG